MTKCYSENSVFQNITQSFIGKLDLTVGDNVVVNTFYAKKKSRPNVDISFIVKAAIDVAVEHESYMASIQPDNFSKSSFDSEDAPSPIFDQVF